MTDFNDTVIRTVALFAGNADLTRAELVEALAKQAVGKMNAEAECDRLRRALKDCVETWRPLLADADLTAHENPAYLTLLHADMVLEGERP
jgi:hypothetical protein